MLNDEINEPSDISYSSAVAPVIKKGGSIQMYIDSPQINAKTIPKIYSILRHEDLLDYFSYAEVFAVLDLRWLVRLKLIQLDLQKTQLPFFILAKNLKLILSRVIKGT